MYAYMVAYGPLQCDEVVQGSLWREALTLPRTSLAFVWSGDKQKHYLATRQKQGPTANQYQVPRADQDNPFALL